MTDLNEKAFDAARKAYHQTQIYTDGYDTLRAAIFAYLAATETSKPVAEAVKVKPLEWWEPDHTNNYTHGAKTIIGTYYVHIDGGRHMGFTETFVNDKIEQWEGPEHGHLYEAQREADYEQRIMSALSTPPQPEAQEPVAWQCRWYSKNFGESSFKEWREGKIGAHWSPGFIEKNHIIFEERALYASPPPPIVKVPDQFELAIREIAAMPYYTLPLDDARIDSLFKRYNKAVALADAAISGDADGK